MTQSLENHLQIVIRDLIGPEQNDPMQGTSIQHNLQIHEIIEGIEDITDDALISSNQSKAFERMDRFLAVVLETTRFEPESHRLIHTLYPNPQAGEREALGVFRDRAVGSVGLFPGPSSLCRHFGAPAPKT